MISSLLVKFDASPIYGGLYIGSRPPPGARAAHAGFDLVVFAAEEYQPPEWRMPGVEVMYVPMQDVPEILSKEQLRTVRLAGERIARALEMNKKVLVTCRAGLNRSSLLAAAALMRLTPMNALQVIRLIRSKRSVFALNNPAFVHAITTQFRREPVSDS